jgi:crotonobetaine/carnitine-CoA ligase
VKESTSTDQMPPLADRTIQRVMYRNLHQIPNKTAISDDTMSLTHAALWERTCRCAGGLRERGIGEGDVVLLMLDNSADYYVVFAALSFLGAIAVPTNTAYKGTILEHVLRTAAPTSAVVEEHYATLLAEAPNSTVHELIVRRHQGSATATRARDGIAITDLADVLSVAPVEPLDVGPWQTLAVMFTSGTTGVSKGALVSQASAFATCFYPQVYGPHDENDTILVVCPMFHATGLFGGPLGAGHLGASVHIVPAFSASRFWDDVRAARATSVILVGAMFDFIMQQPPRPDDRDHTLRTAFMLPRPERAGDGMARFGIQLTTAFGGTECGCVIVNLSTDPEHVDSVGRVRTGWEVRLVDEHDIDVPDGEPGEVIMRSAEPWSMATAYIDNAEASCAAWRNGWLHTGDLLRRNAGGMYYFVDRVKDSIRRRGENISSLEVESEVMRHPDVVECAAIGIGDARIDQEVKIFVRRPGSTLTEAELIHLLIDWMPYYSVPRYVTFVDELPRTPTGKVRKVDLHAHTGPTWDRETAGVNVRRPQPVRQR